MCCVGVGAEDGIYDRVCFNTVDRATALYRLALLFLIELVDSNIRERPRALCRFVLQVVESVYSDVEDKG